MLNFMLQPLYPRLIGGRMGCGHSVNTKKKKMATRAGDQNPVAQPLLDELSRITRRYAFKQ
jgi:hypothetical protein